MQELADAAVCEQTYEELDLASTNYSNFECRGVLAVKYLAMTSWIAQGDVGTASI